MNSSLELPSASECVRFEKESFGALHQMMSSLPEAEKESVWEEIEKELKKVESKNGFTGPCEMVVAVGENHKVYANLLRHAHKRNTYLMLSRVIF